MQMKHGIPTEIPTNVYSILLTLETHATEYSKAFRNHRGTIFSNLEAFLDKQ